MRQQKREDDVRQPLVEPLKEPEMEELVVTRLPPLPGIKTPFFVGNVLAIGGEKRQQKRNGAICRECSNGCSPP